MVRRKTLVTPPSPYNWQRLIWNANVANTSSKWIVIFGGNMAEFLAVAALRISINEPTTGDIYDSISFNNPASLDAPASGWTAMLGYWPHRLLWIPNYEIRISQTGPFHMVMMVCDTLDAALAIL